MEGCRNRFLSDQPSNCTKLKERFLFLRNHAVKLRMEGLICEFFAFKTLDMEDRVYSTDNQIQKIETSSRDGRDTQFRRPCDDRYLVDTLLLFNTVERGSSVQHKINIYGVKTYFPVCWDKSAPLPPPPWLEQV